MEPGASYLLSRDEITDVINKKLGKRVEKLLVVDQKFEYEDLKVQMAIFVLPLEHNHELGQRITLQITPRLREQLLHPVKAPFDILHTLVFVNLIDFQGQFVSDCFFFSLLL